MLPFTPPVGSKTRLIEPQYRYYVQAGASFFSPGDVGFTVGERHQTSDSDLGPFHSHTLSLAVTHFNPWPLGAGSALTTTLAGCGRSDGLQLWWLVLGLDKGF